jgi:integrase
VFSQTFERLREAADVPPIRLHDLRHTHATLLLKAGVPLKVVSERLGHSTPAFTMATYQHVRLRHASRSRRHLRPPYRHRPHSPHATGTAMMSVDSR